MLAIKFRCVLSWAFYYLGVACDRVNNLWYDLHGGDEAADDLLGGMYINDKNWHEGSSVVCDVLGDSYQWFMRLSDKVQRKGEPGPWHEITEEERYAGMQ